MKAIGPLLVKVLAFVTVTAVLTGALVMVFGGFRLAPSTTYQAIFTDISGMRPASPVRAAGVEVGRVEGAERLPDNTILVTFSVDSQIPLTTGSMAVIRYKNVVGDLYLQLSSGPGPALPDGGTIPTSLTRPALDLDELFNGFTPLFQGLQPDQINRLSSALIAVLQGQGGAVEELLSNLGSVTGTLADRGALISDVVGQLDTVLETLSRRAPELNDTIVNLQMLVSGLSEDRERIGRSLTGVKDLTTSLDGLLTQTRPDIKGTIAQLDRVADTLNNDHAALENLSRRLPGYFVPLGRLGANQGAFQFYLCGVQLRFTTPAGYIFTPFTNSGNVPRC
jgi:phospholipid/cholesterol/gamma-HCH transport system substrate-binding protein